MYTKEMEEGKRVTETVFSPHRAQGVSVTLPQFLAVREEQLWDTGRSNVKRKSK